MSIISVYAPTNPTNSTSGSAQPSEAFYEQLQSTLSSVPPSDLLVIMGDFNARVGSNAALMVLENAMRLVNTCWISAPVISYL